MAKFDVYRLPDGAIVVDCQSDLLRQLSTRFVVPLAPTDTSPSISLRLTPILQVAGQEMRMLTHLAATVPISALGRPMASISDQDFTISNAIDMLISGC
jgi:toxin CcdB